MPRGPMTAEQKQAMQAGRKRAKKKARRAPRVASYSFNVDDAGELAIIDASDGGGVTLKLPDARRLKAFLCRALPPDDQSAASAAGE